MRTFAVVLVLAAALALVLYALGVFDSGAPTGPEDPDGPGVAKGGGGRDAPRLESPPPTNPPELEEYGLEDPLHVLLLAGVPQRLPAFLAQSWNAHRDIKLWSWAPPGEQEGMRLAGLRESPPTANDLHDDNIHVLAIHDMDPTVLDEPFWREVVARVKDERLGLLVIPGAVNGPKMLAHPVLSTLFPVADSKPIEGTPVPGTFEGMARFEVTDDGVRHPASRLVPWPSWSSTIWGSKQLGEWAWGTNFAYPVEKAAEGAKILLRADDGKGNAWPAMIIGDPNEGRVLWFGAWDLGKRLAYGRPEIVTEWTTLVRNMAIWLGGRVF